MPSCPTHGKDLRAGKYPGTFYCTQFVGLGAAGANEKGYCDYRVKAPPAPRAQNFATPTTLPISTPVGDPLACAALQFAGSVFHGSQDGDKAVELARRAYDEMRGVA